jgi:hypothetical protein
MIDPAFWNDSRIVALSIPARLLYIGLWNYADDEGFFLDDIAAIKRTLFPDQKFDIHGVFSECSCFLKHHKYKDDEHFAWQISHFLEWQTINRPTASKIKPFCTFSEDSVSAHGGLTPKLREVKLREVKRREDKKKKIQKEKDPLALARFDGFWKEYPKKRGRGAAEKAFNQLNPTDELFQKLIEAVKKQKSWPEWVKENGQYIPHPATWLRQGRWDDEPPITQTVGRNYV